MSCCFDNNNFDPFTYTAVLAAISKRTGDSSAVFALRHDHVSGAD
jgi:hypothetical protein